MLLAALGPLHGGLPSCGHGFARRGGLHPVEADHLAAAQRGEVAALAQLVHQVAQHRLAGAVVNAVEQQALGKPAQARAGVVLVFHNRQWGAEKKNQVDFYIRRFVAGELDNPSFAGIAQAMGAEAIVVDQPADVGPALKRAIDLQMNEEKTCVIEILCTRELGDPFRRDALSKQVRILDKYKDQI